MSYTIPVLAVGWIALGASPHPPYLTIPVYLPFLWCGLSAQTTLSTCCKIASIGNVSVEMCAVILTACSVVHIVHSTHNSREGE